MKERDLLKFAMMGVSALILWSCARSQTQSQRGRALDQRVQAAESNENAGKVTLGWEIQARYSQGKYFAKLINRGEPDAPIETLGPIVYWYFTASRDGQKVPYTSYYQSLNRPFTRMCADSTSSISTRILKKNESFEYQIDIPTVLDMTREGTYDIYIKRAMNRGHQGGWVVSNKVQVKIPAPEVIKYARQP